VVISGGEPTVQPDLRQFIQKVREMGFLVKLDTNGNLPNIMKDLVNDGLIDYIAMDVKTTLNNYENLVGKMVNPDNIKESIEFLKQGTVPYEFRTTVIEGVHTEEIIKEMSELVSGADKLYLQKFRPETTLDPEFENQKPISSEKMQKYIQIFQDANIQEVHIRQ
jgi:pyruvate formate lyase activating enzyme